MESDTESSVTVIRKAEAEPMQKMSQNLSEADDNLEDKRWRRDFKGLERNVTEVESDVEAR